MSLVTGTLATPSSRLQLKVGWRKEKMLEAEEEQRLLQEVERTVCPLLLAPFECDPPPPLQTFVGAMRSPFAPTL